ncbi:hypothetical protein BDU57DRAFT_511324 [Ampelomyces quisqualis]|uniref:CCHC-type domain-containing protein n=1 Tax=Ampelomyces quisqualis TaxID=50730 RepID=A0A6A5QT39_AMPQU|nr:hypothetical protein BDU57DRAFT_511324 [Ampelomyces quisqualis]
MASNTPKTMSSRLMTMKFMQRSAHKATASSPSTPNGPPAKKARLSNGQSAPGTPGTPDHEILQSALAAEEKRRQEALDKAAQHTGETKWVLSFTDPLAGSRQESLQVKQAGFAEIDAVDESEEEEEAVRPIRKQFGGGLKRKEKPVALEKAEESDGEAESSTDEYDSDDPTAELIRETKREVAAENRKARNPAQSPRGPRRTADGDISLFGLQSLSGEHKPRDLSNVECFQCGQKGHRKTECAKSKPRGSAGRGRGRR